MRGLWIAVALFACGKKSEAPTPAPASGATPGSAIGSAAGSATQSGSAAGSASAASADCIARGDKIGKHMHELAARVPGFMPVAKIDAPDSASGKPVDARGFVVAIAKDGKAVVQGTQLPTSKEVFEYFDAQWKSALEKWAMDGKSSKDAHFPVYVWADRGVAAGKVDELVAALNKASDKWAVRLLVASKTAAPAETPPAGAADTAKKMPAADPEATKYLADSIKAAIGECSPIITPFATYVIEGTADKQADKMMGVAKGLVDCNCKIPNVDVFEWGAYEWLGASTPALAWIDMPKLTKNDKQPLAKVVK